jgi:hypothetical protein
MSEQPGSRRLKIRRDTKTSPVSQIRLNDLIPREDVKAGRRTVFGAKPQPPGKKRQT